MAGRGFWRGVFFYPVLLSPVVVALIWKWILQREGLLNAVLVSVGGSGVEWLTSASWANSISRVLRLVRNLSQAWRIFARIRVRHFSFGGSPFSDSPRLSSLVLASIGLYGVVALALGQRRREIGIRIAVGARPQQVVRMFLAGGLRLSLVGLAIGLPLSIVAMKFVAAKIKLPGVNIALVEGGRQGRHSALRAGDDDIPEEGGGSEHSNLISASG